jgi:hypothetical protein
MHVQTSKQIGGGHHKFSLECHQPSLAPVLVQPILYEGSAPVEAATGLLRTATRYQHFALANRRIPRTQGDTGGERHVSELSVNE